MKSMAKSCEIDAWNYLSERIAEIETRCLYVTKLREVNLNVANLRPDEAYFLSLDSSLKKNAAFVRKVKSFSAAYLDSLLLEMKTLNLTKYLGEISGALLESKLKMADIPSATKLCSAIHQYYSEFSTILFETWNRIFNTDSSDWYQPESKLKVNLMFYAELIVTGVFTSEESFLSLQKVISAIISSDMEEQGKVAIILSFCKCCGNEFAGLIPRPIQQLATTCKKSVPVSNIISQDKQNHIRALLKEYHTSLCKHLIRLHRELFIVVREEKRMFARTGEVYAEKKRQTNAMLRYFQDVHKCYSELGEHLSEDSSFFLRDELSWVKIVEHEETDIVPSELWDDAESRNFYEHFPCIKDILPSPALSSSRCRQEGLEKEKHGEMVRMEEHVSPRNVNVMARFKDFLENLPNCVNRELIDNFSLNFAMTYNKKRHRKQLVQTLFAVPRNRIDLLPLYARLVATLNPTMPDVADELRSLLLKEYRYLCRKKCQINIESKLKVVNFIGELVKFRAFPASEALDCMRWLLMNFTHPHHIEMFCGLMDACGGFLFRQPEFRQRVKVYLEDMMHKKAAWSLDPRHSAMMESTYYQVNPFERATTPQKNRPIMHEFIRKLLYEDLNRNSCDNVLKSMRKLDWGDRKLASYAVKCLANASNVKYHNIRYLAEVVCGLSYCQEFVGIQVVDAVLEDIRLGMELDAVHHNQRRLAMARYLGELHNFYLMDTGEVLDVLHQFVDGPASSFRVRLACALLASAGRYITCPGHVQRLDDYLALLRDFHRSAPARADPKGAAFISHLLRDTLTELRPRSRCRVESRTDAVVDLERDADGDRPRGSEAGNHPVRESRLVGRTSGVRTPTPTSGGAPSPSSDADQRARPAPPPGLAARPRDANPTIRKNMISILEGLQSHLQSFDPTKCHQGH